RAKGGTRASARAAATILRATVVQITAAGGPAPARHPGRVAANGCQAGTTTQRPVEADGRRAGGEAGSGIGGPDGAPCVRGHASYVRASGDDPRNQDSMPGLCALP